jgi:hypothetical protein
LFCFAGKPPSKQNDQPKKLLKISSKTIKGLVPSVRIFRFTIRRLLFFFCFSPVKPAAYSETLHAERRVRLIFRQCAEKHRAVAYAKMAADRLNAWLYCVTR